MARIITKTAVENAFKSGVSKIPVSKITKDELTKVEDLGSVRVYKRKNGRTGGWLYVDYQDPSTGKWIRNQPIRLSEYKKFIEYHEDAKRKMPRSVWEQSAGSHFRTAMNEAGNKRMLTRTWLNKAKGLLKAMRRHEADPDFDPGIAMRLMDALRRGDYLSCKAIIEEWEAFKSAREINDYYAYEVEDAELFDIL